MSTGIVSSKEGHDESHIDNPKLETKFWNDANEVTIRLNPKYSHRDCLDYKGKLLQLPFEHWMALPKTWEHRLDEADTKTQCEMNKRSGMTHESGSTQRQAEYPID